MYGIFVMAFYIHFQQVLSVYMHQTLIGAMILAENWWDGMAPVRVWGGGAGGGGGGAFLVHATILHDADQFTFFF
jgi:hypothetical protein